MAGVYPGYWIEIENLGNVVGSHPYVDAAPIPAFKGTVRLQGRVLQSLGKRPRHIGRTYRFAERDGYLQFRPGIRLQQSKAPVSAEPDVVIIYNTLPLRARQSPNDGIIRLKEGERARPLEQDLDNRQRLGWRIADDRHRELPAFNELLDQYRPIAAVRKSPASTRPAP